MLAAVLAADGEYVHVCNCTSYAPSPLRIHTVVWMPFDTVIFDSRTPRPCGPRDSWATTDRLVRKMTGLTPGPQDISSGNPVDVTRCAAILAKEVAFAPGILGQCGHVILAKAHALDGLHGGVSTGRVDDRHSTLLSQDIVDALEAVTLNSFGDIGGQVKKAFGNSQCFGGEKTRERLQDAEHIGPL